MAALSSPKWRRYPPPSSVCRNPSDAIFLSRRGGAEHHSPTAGDRLAPSPRRGIARRLGLGRTYITGMALKLYLVDSAADAMSSPVVPPLQRRRIDRRGLSVAVCRSLVWSRAARGNGPDLQPQKRGRHHSSAPDEKNLAAQIIALKGE